MPFGGGGGVKMGARGDNTPPLKKQINTNDYRVLFDDGVVWGHANFGEEMTWARLWYTPCGVGPHGSDVEG